MANGFAEDESPGGRARDPLADYVLAPGEQVKPPVNRSQPETTYETLPPPPSLPLEDVVWPPPVHGQQPDGQIYGSLSATPFRPLTVLARVVEGSVCSICSSPP